MGMRGRGASSLPPLPLLPPHFSWHSSGCLGGGGTRTEMASGGDVLLSLRTSCWTQDHLKQPPAAAYSDIHPSSDQGKSHLYACVYGQYSQQCE